MSPRAKLFWILWLAGFAGVLSLALIDLDRLIALLPIPNGGEKIVLPPWIMLLSLAQPTLLLSVAILLGVLVAPKVGLKSPVAEAIANRTPIGPALRPQLIPGVAGGLVGGILVVLLLAQAPAFVPPETVARIAELGALMPAPTRLLYGGIDEELLLRWGVMTLLVWTAWKLFRRRKEGPTPACFLGAILLSAVVFGAGHLPIASLLVPKLSLPFAAFVVVTNSVFGVIAGLLYWWKGLESAIIAHMLTHVAMLTAAALASQP